MMNIRQLINLTLAVLLVLSTALILPSSTAEANTPGSAIDNACYTGGLMAGTCEGDFDWDCGWHLARWNRNGGSLELDPNKIASCGLDTLVNTAASQGSQPIVTGSSLDNACYPGGLMAGRCDSDWAWSCGWHLAQWQRNGGWGNDNNSFPSSCNPDVLLPSEPPPPPPPTPQFPVGGCELDGLGNSVNFNGGYIAPIGTPTFSDTTCTTAGANLTENYIFAPAGFDPAFLCESAFPGSTVGAQFNTIYECA